MAELVFSINNIFNAENSDGCLEQHSADRYHIPAYQRGYKWGSLHETDPVRMLLKDLYEAFEAAKKNPDKEYYLQYITVKRSANYVHLEVIDGQQRLTTLSILLSVLSRKVKGTVNIAINKLDYAIRENFFVRHIYPANALTVLLNTNWDKDKGIVLSEEDQGIAKHRLYNNQDVFYITEAAKAMDNFMSVQMQEEELPNFYHFVLNNVFLIVNAVEPYVSSEQVFSNLNSNKVPLTEPELIKALILTKAAREKDNRHQSRHFKEILELRASMGRTWDEISRWVNNKAVKSFYFEETDGMKGLLSLVAVKMGYHPDKVDQGSHHPLFNYFHKQSNISGIFDKLKKYYQILKDWYENDKKYNLLGFVLFAKGSSHRKNKTNLIANLLDRDQFSFSEKLTSIRNELITVDFDKLLYDGTSPNDEIHRLLLAINVFNTDASKITRFDFFAFKRSGWTLEHIFSQRPEGKGKILTADDKTCIINILGASMTEKIQKTLDKKTRTDAEKEIYYEALQKHNLINSIGNMTLLTGEDNSSNGNGQFDAKRSNILELVRGGSFVPKHTFEVFSKLILPNPGDLRNWGRTNIDEHADHIKKTIDKLKQNIYA
ncbi:DUF262 domain-containing protein [Mucilaginibacter sp. OK283]|jgi:hypothetical protein|uniref:DUF262 domain-containing protein n=1 Tax=Mucilaginibacter sp. OK283 TaxID=1881049 RepID=UPI0008CD8AD4|nr:DUF262 domain-containing protein [Mucilaginibacter sp. OK283]SEO79176.1 Uncharacterized conserved protein, contains ParB-like and HNH nuclease domains [Mucilaginibacter sp. OK283]